MSESVKVGGIGKNPAIDKINRLNGIDVKSYAVDRMEQLLISGDSFMDRIGEEKRRRHKERQMAGNKLS